MSNSGHPLVATPHFGAEQLHLENELKGVLNAKNEHDGLKSPNMNLNMSVGGAVILSRSKNEL